MRDLTNYSDNYCKLHFEDTQVVYRKKNIVERIKNYEHKHVLEVGCGLDPFCNCFTDFESMVIIEPSRYFYENAKDIIINSS